MIATIEPHDSPVGPGFKIVCRDTVGNTVESITVSALFMGIIYLTPR